MPSDLQPPTAPNAQPGSSRVVGEPIDIIGYIWSLRRFLPLGLLVTALVFGGAVAYQGRASSGENVSGTVLTVLRIPAGGGAAGTSADAAAAASTMAALALSPEIVKRASTTTDQTPETIRAHVNVYATGTTVNVAAFGLDTTTATTVASEVASALVAIGPQLAPMSVGGSPMKVVPAVEPYVTAVTTSSRSRIQGYLLAGMLALGLGFAATAGAGWWAGRRRTSAGGRNRAT